MVRINFKRETGILNYIIFMKRRKKLEPQKKRTIIKNNNPMQRIMMEKEKWNRGMNHTKKF